MGKEKKEIDLGSRKKITETLTLTLDLMKAKDGEERVLPVPTHRRHYRRLSINSAWEETLAGPPQQCVLGQQGTIAKPFDGGVLSLTGNAHAGEGPRGSATTISSRHGRSPLPGLRMSRG